MRKGILLATTQWLRAVGHTLLDLLYPLRCAGCGQPGTSYCSDCRDAAPRVLLPICPLCGQTQERMELCARCAGEPLRIDGIRSVALFEGTLRQAIHRFKYRSARDLAAPLGEMIADFWREHPLSADLIVPVPLHARRLKERGYNQAQLLADQLGGAIGITVAGDVLRRTRYTMAQARLDGGQRRQNVQGAFLCQDSRVRDRPVLLIDDICTTGATLESCSVALREGGACSVWALTLARTPYSSI